MLSADTGQKGKPTPQRAIRAIYGSVPVEKAPNLHADPCQAEMRKDRLLTCSLFRSLPLWSLLMFLLSLETTKETLRRHFRLQMSPILADSLYSQTSIIHFWENS